MKNPIVLISVFRESLIGGLAVHSSNLYERLLENGYQAERIDYAFLFRRSSVPRRIWIVFKIGVRLLELRLRGSRLFHLHASNRALLFYIYAPMLYLTGARIVLSLHSGYGYERWVTDNPIYHRLNKVFFRLLNRLVFMNPEESARIRARYPFLSDRIVTVNPFIGPPDKELPVLGRHPDHERMKIATIGVWEQRYNVEEAVAAAVRFHAVTGVPTTITVLQSTIREEPVYKQRTMVEIEEARQSIEVVILEDRKDILAILAAHDVFVRPSYLDSYGLWVAESLLVGTPAIATDVCRRCSAAMLYTRGETETLDRHLMTAWENRDAPRKSGLADTEDSFNGYLKEYLDLGLKNSEDASEVKYVS